MTQERLNEIREEVAALRKSRDIAHRGGYIQPATHLVPHAEQLLDEVERLRRMYDAMHGALRALHGWSAADLINVIRFLRDIDPLTVADVAQEVAS